MCDVYILSDWKHTARSDVCVRRPVGGSEPEKKKEKHPEDIRGPDAAVLFTTFTSLHHAAPSPAADVAAPLLHSANSAGR